MSILEPGEEPIEVAVAEEAPVVIPVVTLPPKATRDVCDNCRRGVWEDEVGWHHLDARIDIVTHPAFCLAALYVEEPVRWGFLNVGRRSEFTVTDGRGSRGSGGLAA